MLSVMGHALKVNLKQILVPVRTCTTDSAVKADMHEFVGEASLVVLQTFKNSAGADTVAHTSIQVLNMQAVIRDAICAVKSHLQSLDGMCLAAQAIVHVVLM